MQRTSKWLIVTALLLVPFMVFARGRREQPEGQTGTETTTTETTTDMTAQTANNGLPTTMARVSELIDTRVEVNPNATATVVDVVSDWQGNIPYVIMTFEGVSGAEDQRYIVPLTLIDLARAERRDQAPKFVVSLDDTAIAGAPTLQEGRLPDTTASNWDQSIVTYWQENMTNESEEVGQVAVDGGSEAPEMVAGASGIAATWGQRQAILVNEQLIGFNAVNRTGETLGKVEDAVVDFAGVGLPSIVYLAISGTATLGAAAPLYPIPFSGFSLDIDKKEITVDTTETQLSQSFTQDAWPAEVDQPAVGAGGTNGAGESQSGTTTESTDTTTTDGTTTEGTDTTTTDDTTTEGEQTTTDSSSSSSSSGS